MPKQLEIAGHVLSVDIDVGVWMSPEDWSTRNSLLLLGALLEVLGVEPRFSGLHTEPSCW